MTDELRLPAVMAQRAREFQGPPVPARPAATVVLLRRNGERPSGETPSGETPSRETPSGETPSRETPEVYLLRRRSTMAFGGVYAFPGGSVDPADRPETLRRDWADRLGVPDEQARAVVGAAMRELFEETGVLLAGRADEPDRTVGDTTTDDWEADRVRVAGRELTMAELLHRRGLRLRDDLLLPWARWVTPEFEPRRFDTWFFVALLPEAQTARDVSGEADRTTWISPAAADGLALLPPTRAMLNDLRPYHSLDEVVSASARRNAAAPVMPRVELTDDGGAVVHINR